MSFRARDWYHSRVRLHGALHAAAVVASVATIGAAVEACSYAWNLPDTVGEDGGGDATQDGIAPGSDAGGDGGTKGCASSKECDAGSHCAFADHQCGKGQATGTCVVNDTPCPVPAGDAGAGSTPEAGIPPIGGSVSYCGCDGKAYDSTCALSAAGIDLGIATCVAIPQQRACGYLLCPTPVDFCVVEKKDDSYRCAPFKSAATGSCAVKDCACTNGACPGEAASCKMDTTGVVVTCTP